MAKKLNVKLINLIFQGRSSDHFESVQSVVSAASSKIEERYSSGLISFIIAHSIRENAGLVQVLKDEEGVQIMKILGKNMVWILKSIEAGKMNNVLQPIF